MSASVAFLARCGRLVRTKVAAWTPCACRGTVLVLRKDNFKVKTTLSFGGEDPVSVAAVVDTGAGPSVFSEDLLPPGWRAHSWRAPTRTRIVAASGQALKALARLPLTMHVHDKPLHFPLIVVKRLSVPLIIGRDCSASTPRRSCPRAARSSGRRALSRTSRFTILAPGGDSTRHRPSPRLARTS